MAEFTCCVCKKDMESTGALHFHHICTHTLEELSLAVLAMSGQLAHSSQPSSNTKEEDLLRSGLAKHPHFLLTCPSLQPIEGKLSKNNVNMKAQINKSSKIALNTEVPNHNPSQKLHEVSPEGVNGTQTKVKKSSNKRPASVKQENLSLSKRSMQKRHHYDYSEKPNLCEQNKDIDVSPKYFNKELNSSSTIDKSNLMIIENPGQMEKSKSESILEEHNVNKEKFKENAVEHLKENIQAKSATGIENNVNLQISTEKTFFITPNDDLVTQSPQLYLALTTKHNNANQVVEKKTNSLSKMAKSNVFKALPTKTTKANSQRNTKTKSTKTKAVNTASLVENEFDNRFFSVHGEVQTCELNQTQYRELVSLKPKDIPTIVDSGDIDSMMTLPSIMPSKLGPATQASSGRKFSCEKCVRSYKKKSHLERHIRSHTGERPFACDVCTKRFTVKSVLKQHQRTHTGERPFECSVCGARFPQTSGLMTHMMLHTGKPFKCEICNKSFVSNHKLLNHVRNHSGERPHQCTMCNNSFFTGSALEEHLSRIHLQEKKFICDICKIGFKLEVNLKVHLDGHIQKLGAEELLKNLHVEQEDDCKYMDEDSTASNDIHRNDIGAYSMPG